MDLFFVFMAKMLVSNHINAIKDKRAAAFKMLHNKCHKQYAYRPLRIMVPIKCCQCFLHCIILKRLSDMLWFMTI